MKLKNYNNKLNELYKECTEELHKIDKELESIGRRRSSIVVKKIDGKMYYYEQWKEDGKIKNISLGRLAPGAVAEEEKKILRRIEYMQRYKELIQVESMIKSQLDELKKDLLSPELEDYTFEVYWKDEISARVSVKGKRVHVSRYIIHPIRQLFYSDSISRNQLNEILKLRCFDEERTDSHEKLKALGLKEYKPLDIVRKTHGVSYNDFLWFRFPGENITAKDVLVR